MSKKAKKCHCHDCLTERVRAAKPATRCPFCAEVEPCGCGLSWEKLTKEEEKEG